MNGRMIIDGHAHSCGEYLTAESIEQKMSAAKIDFAILTSGQYGSNTTYSLKNVAQEKPFGDVVSKNNRITSFMISLIGAIRQIPKGNEYVYQLRQALPNRVKQCYWVTRENWKNVQLDFERMHFNVIKFHQCWEKFDFCEAFFTKTVEWASEKGIPVFVHIRDLTQVGKMIEFIRMHPKAIIVIGHLYGVELFMQEKREYFENTYFDLSNCYFVSKERTMLAYQHFGAEHLLMGSDTPYGKHSLEQTMQQISQLPISTMEQEQILGLNWARLLNLPI